MRVRVILVLAVIELCVLGFMAGQREWVLGHGRTITLRTEPVDPSDPLRGEYAHLNYGFSSVRRAQWRDGLADAVKARGTRSLVDLKVYGLLRIDATGMGEFTGLSDRPPASGPYLAGRVTSSSGDLLNVRYGIEALFMEQGAAAKLEADRQKSHAGAQLDVDVAVGPSGLAVLKGYSWEPLGLTVTFERPTVAKVTKPGAPPQPKTFRAANPGASGPAVAVVKLVNYGPDSVAVALDPDGGSFALVADLLRANGNPAYHWVGESAAPAGAAGATVTVLKPGQSIETRIDLTQPRWLVTGPKDSPSKGAPVAMRDLHNVWNAWFRIEYVPPSPEQSAGLPHPDLLWHRTVTSRAFAASGGID